MTDGSYLTGGEVQAFVSWDSFAGTPPVTANQFLIQAIPSADNGHVSEFIINIGVTAPPPIIAPPMDGGAVNIFVQPVTRLILSASRARELYSLLGQIVKQTEEIYPSSGGDA